MEVKEIMKRVIFAIAATVVAAIVAFAAYVHLAPSWNSSDRMAQLQGLRVQRGKEIDVLKGENGLAVANSASSETFSSQAYWTLYGYVAAVGSGNATAVKPVSVNDFARLIGAENSMPDGWKVMAGCDYAAATNIAAYDVELKKSPLFKAQEQWAMDKAHGGSMSADDASAVASILDCAGNVTELSQDKDGIVSAMENSFPSQKNEVVTIFSKNKIAAQFSDSEAYKSDSSCNVADISNKISLLSMSKGSEDDVLACENKIDASAVDPQVLLALNRIANPGEGIRNFRAKLVKSLISRIQANGSFRSKVTQLGSWRVMLVMAQYILASDAETPQWYMDAIKTAEGQAQKSDDMLEEADIPLAAGACGLVADGTCPNLAAKAKDLVQQHPMSSVIDETNATSWVLYATIAQALHLTVGKPTLAQGKNWFSKELGSGEVLVRAQRSGYNAVVGAATKGLDFKDIFLKALQSKDLTVAASAEQVGSLYGMQIDADYDKSVAAISSYYSVPGYRSLKTDTAGSSNVDVLTSLDIALMTLGSTS